MTDLENQKREALHNITVLESKLEKLKISPEWVGRLNFIMLIYVIVKINLTLKQYFYNKSLIVYVNHVLLGFLFMSV